MEVLTLADIPEDRAEPFLALADKFSVLGAPRKGLRCLGIFYNGELCGAISVIVSGDMVWLDRGGGAHPDIQIARRLPPIMEQWARMNGLRTIATATKRRGYVAELEAAGFEVAGTILKKDIQ